MLVISFCPKLPIHKHNQHAGDYKVAKVYVAGEVVNEVILNSGTQSLNCRSHSEKLDSNENLLAGKSRHFSLRTRSTSFLVDSILIYTRLLQQ